LPTIIYNQFRIGMSSCKNKIIFGYNENLKSSTEDEKEPDYDEDKDQLEEEQEEETGEITINKVF
jgi:hypothetical protein